ncbi:hypothetical protein [Bartonella sp. F02]|uniref:hypothetical protein n=1 Tax=Bartonella sp. F02 TaxID=2967262 RepID=UPI0022A9232A|nr:hypothetical protein [Bartonella sp. F02]MCZ2328411.1 hypothetical protein [Bartonella sp. F02]
MKNTFRNLYLIIAAFLLVACSFSQNYEQYLSVHNKSSGINGEWIDENGIISSFYNGIFETRAADTNEKLSEGTYTYINSQHVEIEIHSILRGTISQVNCSISNNATQLICTPRSGLQFVLNRKI